MTILNENFLIEWDTESRFGLLMEYGEPTICIEVVDHSFDPTQLGIQFQMKA